MRHSNTLKLNLALAFLLVSLVTMGAAIYQSIASSANDPQIVSASFDGPTEQERKEIRDEFTELLDLTPDQQKQIDSIRDEVLNDPNRMPFEVMIEAYQILTPEQQKIANENRGNMMSRGREMMEQRMKEAQETLSPEDFERFQDKASERRSRFMERMSESGMLMENSNQNSN